MAEVEGLRERPFCPAIQETYRSLAHHDDAPDVGGGAPVGLIAGAGGKPDRWVSSTAG